MDIFNIIGFAIISLILILTIKEQRPDIAMLLSLVSGTIILVFAMLQLESIVDMLNSLIETGGNTGTAVPGPGSNGGPVGPLTFN